MTHVCDPLRPPWDPCPCRDIEPADAHLDAVVESGPPEPEACPCGLPLCDHRVIDREWRYRTNREVGNDMRAARNPSPVAAGATFTPLVSPSPQEGIPMPQIADDRLATFAARCLQDHHQNGTPIDFRSVRELAAHLDAIGKACAYCGCPADSIDHVMPHARGGTHLLANLVPCCTPCNIAKQDKTPDEWGGIRAARTRFGCGTPRGYTAHRAKGTPPCIRCKRAIAAYQARKIDRNGDPR